jgi:hypothetical protein
MGELSVPATPHVPSGCSAARPVGEEWVAEQETHKHNAAKGGGCTSTREHFKRYSANLGKVNTQCHARARRGAWGHATRVGQRIRPHHYFRPPRLQPHARTHMHCTHTHTHTPHTHTPHTRGRQSEKADGLAVDGANVHVGMLSRQEEKALPLRLLPPSCLPSLAEAVCDGHRMGTFFSQHYIRNDHHAQKKKKNWLEAGGKNTRTLMKALARSMSRASKQTEH